MIGGRLSLGALVAVLAAYKDFSAPLRELFRYYQSAEDARVRYREVLNFLQSGASAPARAFAQSGEAGLPSAPKRSGAMISRRRGSLVRPSWLGVLLGGVLASAAAPSLGDESAEVLNSLLEPV